jgi:SAM-dependent methyltransferase
MLAKLLCPACRAEIVQSASGWSCPACGKTLPVRHGVLSFLSDEQKFNEGDFADWQKGYWTGTAQLREKIRQSKFLSFLNKLRIKFSFSGKRDRIFYNEMKGRDKNRLILDMGCGGGRHYFRDYGNVIGVDPTLGLLQISKKLYNEVYHAGGYQLPFPDNTFDNVFSVDVIGHIPPEKKDVFFSELRRVLKPGGRAVLVIETDSTNYWMRQLKRDRRLFQKYAVDIPGHYGLELPSELRARFTKHDFKEIRFKRVNGNLQCFGDMSGGWWPDFANFNGLTRFLLRVDKVLAFNLYFRECLHFLLEPISFIEERLTPLDHGSTMMVVMEK